MTYTKIKFSLLLCFIEFNKKNPYLSLSLGFFKSYHLIIFRIDNFLVSLLCFTFLFLHKFYHHLYFPNHLYLSLSKRDNQKYVVQPYNHNMKDFHYVHS